MKTSVKIAALIALLPAASNAAITISGTSGTSYKSQDGTTNLPIGIHYMLIGDSGNGFLAGYSGVSPVGASLTGQGSASNPKVTVADAGIAYQGTFGGDTILAIGTTTSAGVIGSLITSQSIAGFENKNFAMVYFQKSAVTLALEGMANQYFGIIRGADWVFPSADSGTYTFSATDASPTTNYYSFSAAATAAQIGGGFFTGSGTAANTGSTAVRSAQFQIVPEPSAALLGALGALGLLRRRRN